MIRRVTPPPPTHNITNHMILRKYENISKHALLHGSQGRLLHWHPEATASLRKALPAYCTELSARFCKEGALSKVEMMPDMDFMDLGARLESLNIRGEPVLLQLCMVPAYALTVRSPLS